MPVEIERKFLVRGDTWRAGAMASRIVQAYLSRDPERTVRVRVREDRAWLTVKGRTRGLTRTEIEVPLPLGSARELLPLCLPRLIEKTRHVLQVGNHAWEIDEFHGANAGLVLAEVELTAEDEAFEKPPWLGCEVSDDPRYSNARLAAHPFSEWSDAAG